MHQGDDEHARGHRNREGGAFIVLSTSVLKAPFSLAVRDVIVEAVNRIMALETGRGEISRTKRSALSAAAQPLQDLIDRLFYAMAGLTDSEIASLEKRLPEML
jgi:hypothetical protein